MNISSHSFATPDNIIADVQLMVGDPEGKDFGDGILMSHIQQAMQELAFDTFFDERSVALEVPATRRLDMPKGCFNLRQMYLFSGARCDFDASRVVYHAENFFHRGGSGFVKRNTFTNIGDPFHRHHGGATLSEVEGMPSGTSAVVPHNLYFYEVQNGVIMLSEACSRWPKILIQFNGTGCEIGDAPIIPLYLRRAVKDYVTVEILRIRAATDQQWRSRYMDALSQKDGRTNPPFDGSWYQAEYRIKCMDNKERSDLKEYLSRMNY